MADHYNVKRDDIAPGAVRFQHIRQASRGEIEAAERMAGHSLPDDREASVGELEAEERMAGGTRIFREEPPTVITTGELRKAVTTDADGHHVADTGDSESATDPSKPVPSDRNLRLRGRAPKSVEAHVGRADIDDIRLFGMLDRCLSEMKYIVDHPHQFDLPTFQTMKHHLEDMELFYKHATGKLQKLGVIKTLPPTREQKEAGL